MGRGLGGIPGLRENDPKTFLGQRLVEEHRVGEETVATEGGGEGVTRKTLCNYNIDWEK